MTPPDFHAAWKPCPDLPNLPDHSPFYSLTSAHPLVTSIPAYTAGHPNVIIVSSTRITSISITVKDLRELVSHNSLIYQELIILSLEVLCKDHGGSYLDPSFFTTLKDHNWSYISWWFASRHTATVSHPHLTADKISIPIHIHGNHWVALCRRILDNRIVFLYFDDMNNSRTEEIIKGVLYSSKVSREFCPVDSLWINCKAINSKNHTGTCSNVVTPTATPVYAYSLHEPKPSTPGHDMDDQFAAIRSCSSSLPLLSLNYK
jgi:hypothetical protein